MATKWITVGKRHIPIDDKKGMSKSIRQHYRNKKTSKIPPKEYSEVRHMINNDCNIYRHGTQYKKGGTYSKAYKNHLYEFTIIDYDTYYIFRKTKLK